MANHLLALSEALSSSLRQVFVVGIPRRDGPEQLSIKACNKLLNDEPFCKFVGVSRIKTISKLNEDGIHLSDSGVKDLSCVLSKQILGMGLLWMLTLLSNTKPKKPWSCYGCIRFLPNTRAHQKKHRHFS